jgi:dihydroxyacetone kinase DhaKLM complex PTS-EIIA-like component DhaM
METLDIELKRNGAWRRGFTLKDADEVVIDLTGATFDMDIRHIAGLGDPLLSGSIIPDNLEEGYFEVELLGSAFADIGSSVSNVRLVFDIVITQDDIPTTVLEGTILLLPAVSDGVSSDGD